MSISVRSETFSSAMPGKPRRDRFGLAIIVLVAIALMSPELVLGLTVTDNFRFNMLWPEQFGALMRGGHLYPRWLPQAWEGLGTPAFYFYPPIFFWATGIFDTLTAGALSSERFVPFASLLLMLVSGLGMRAWLRTKVEERTALFGAVVFMAAPYHLYDIYCRGALAEATAYASVPFVMLALARVAEGRARWVPVLALSYGALLMSHLPTALLVSLLLIPPYVAWTVRSVARPARFLGLALAGGAIGIGIAAAYLIPALTLLPYVNPGSLTRAFYRPENWFFWTFPAGPMGARMMFIIPVAVGAALVAIGTCLGTRKEKEALFWAGLTIVLVALIAGLVPPFWRLPGLVMVQFPWRGLLLVEFTTITMLAVTTPSLRNPIVLAGAVTISFAYAVLAMMAGHTIWRTWAGQADNARFIRASYLDAPEYLPAGVRIKEGAGPDDVEVKLAVVPLARASDRRAMVSASEAIDGSMTLTIDGPAPTVIAVRRYYFPNWRVSAADGTTFPVVPEPREHIATFRAPAGKSVLRLEPGSAPNEILARTVSLVALALTALWAFVARRKAAAA